MIGLQVCAIAAVSLASLSLVHMTEVFLKVSG